MTTPLRLGYLFSGLMHMAAVAAFSLSSEPEIVAVDEPRPLTLQLALFKPAQAAIPQAPAIEPQTPVAATQPPPRPLEPQQEDMLPVDEPPPPPVVRRVQPKSPVPKPKPVVRRPDKPRPTVNRTARARPVETANRETKPVESRPVPSASVALKTAPNPQPVAAVIDVQEKQHYLAALAAKIDRKKYYPLGSRRRGEEGTVVVRFVVQKNGGLTELGIVESSGSRRLDAAALKTLRRVSPFRPIPEALGRDQWSISVPIAFSLRG